MFSEEWVVFEAVSAHLQDGFRFIESVSVIDRYEDSLNAMKRYKQIAQRSASERNLLSAYIASGFEN